MLAESFTVTQRYIVDLIKKLRDGSEGRVEVLEAICDLGEVGQGYDAIPALADVMACAHAEGDEEMMDAVSEVRRSHHGPIEPVVQSASGSSQPGRNPSALVILINSSSSS